MGSSFSFFQRPWFTRVWVVQEVALAREINILCGEWELNWRFLAELINKWFQSKLLMITIMLEVPQAVTIEAQKAAMSLGQMLRLRLSRSHASRMMYELRKL